MKKTIMMVAGDPGPSGLFEVLADELTRLGHVVNLLVRKDLPDVVSGKHIDSIKTSNALLVGMSSTSEVAASEIACAELAISYGVPVGLLPDTFGVISRQGFEEVGRKASFACVLNEDEKYHDRSVVKPEISYVTGDPRWDIYFAPPRLTREEVFGRLGVGLDRELVLFAGSKFSIMTAGPLMIGLTAIHGLDPSAARIHAVLGLHPADECTAGEYEHQVTNLFRNSPVSFSILPDELKTDEMLPHAVLVIGTSSSTTIHTACRRKPGLWPGGNPWEMELYASIRTFAWPPCDQGAFLRRKGLTPELLGELLDPDSKVRKDMLLAQEKMFPKPEGSETAVSEMTRVILAHAK